MNSYTEILFKSIVTPLAVIAFLAAILAATMLCCICKKSKVKKHSISSKEPTSQSIGNGCTPDIELIEGTGRKLILTDSKSLFRVENAQMYITETVGSTQGPWRNSHRTSLSTIFSETQSSLPVMTTPSPTLTSLSKRISKADKDSLQYYTITWTSPDLCQEGVGLPSSIVNNKQEGINSVASTEGSVRSNVSNKSAKSNHPIQRLHTLRSEGSQQSRHKESDSTPTDVFSPVASAQRQAKLSNTAAELSQFLERSDENDTDSEHPVFYTHHSNPYYPNPNTPVTEDEESEETTTLSNDTAFYPNNNTPVQTIEMSSSDNIMAQVVWASSASDEMVMQQPDSLVTESSTNPIAYHDETSTELQSVSMIQNPMVRHHLTSEQPVSIFPGSPAPASSLVGQFEETQASLNTAENQKTWTIEHTYSIDGSESDLVRHHRILWHYNKAYDGEPSNNTLDSGCRADVSSSAGVHGGGYLSNPASSSDLKTKSGETSMNAQVGSRDTSHPSNTYDPPYHKQLHMRPNSTATTLSLELSSILPRETVKKANFFGARSNRISDQSGREMQLLDTRRSKSGRRVKRLHQSLSKLSGSKSLIDQPLLSPQVYWV